MFCKSSGNTNIFINGYNRKMINENVFAFLLAPELMETANWSSLLFQHEKLVIISYSFVHRLKHAEVS